MRTDLVVLNFGGPRRREEVEPFLRELLGDPDVIRLPFGPRVLRWFARRLAARRAPLVGPHYDHIGGSPLVPTTFAQVDALKAALGDGAPRIWVAMRYTEPSIAEVARAIAADPPERLVALALYPHFSGTTTGSSYTALARQLRAVGLGGLPVHYVPAFYDHPSYIRAVRELILGQIAASRDPAQVFLLFSAHGIPSSYARDHGDPYPDQVRESVRTLVAALCWQGAYGLAYQSRLGPVRWLEPSTEHEITRLADEGIREIVVVPLSFVTEGIETLYELDIQLAEVAEKRGVTLRRVPAVNTHPDFIACLADVVQKALEDESHAGLGAFRCVRCLLPKPHAHRTRAHCLDCGHSTPEYLLCLPTCPSTCAREPSSHREAESVGGNDSISVTQNASE